MALGGRPREEGGHAPVKLSLNEGIQKCLQKVEGRDEVVSQSVEKVLKGPCKQLDPGPSCADVSDVMLLLDEKIASAHQRREYGRTAGTAESTPAETAPLLQPRAVGASGVHESGSPRP